jgi:formylglycine-generating enzyme required for sulfatase activity
MRSELNQTERRFLLLLDANELIKELSNPSTPRLRRAAIGDRLAEIGDERPGVGLRGDGIPHVLWCEVPGGQISLEGGAGTFSVPPFQIAKYPVTWAQYRTFLELPDGYANSAWWEQLVQDELPGDTERSANQPAENVSWYDAVAFCRWLSARLGYEVRLAAEWEWEWEAAATGCEATRQYPWGTDWDSRNANTEESRLARSTAVGMYPNGASDLGILDLSGNVWEWCINQYEAPHAVALAGDGPRVVRGGSWSWKNEYARLTRRDLPGYRNRYHGFRLARFAV